MDPDRSPYPLPPEPLPMDRAALAAALGARLARAPLATPSGQGPRVAPLSEAIDPHLAPGGLAAAGLHEILAAEPGAAAGFAAVVLGRVAAAGGAVLWIGPDPGAGLLRPSRFGLSPAALLLVRAPDPSDALWAMEEALRCPAVAGALLAAPEPGPAAARRLQLAAEAGGALGLLLRADNERPVAAGALTRWRVGALAGEASPHCLGDPRWQLELLRCRGGAPGRWSVTWHMATDRLVADAEAPPAATRRRRA